MIIFNKDRASDSPFVERVWSSYSDGSYPFLSVAESRCELVVTRYRSRVMMTLRGPETRMTSYGDGPSEGEWLGIRLKPGVFLPSLPPRRLVDATIMLPEASNNTFWLGGYSWTFPDFENAETFIAHVVRAGVLEREPIVGSALRGQIKDLSSRSIQRRFLYATGLTQRTMRQIERARYATLLLRQGSSIQDTIVQAGYFDQPHLNRALKYYIGQTPAQILHGNALEQLSYLYKTTLFE